MPRGNRSRIIFSPSLENFRDPASRPRLRLGIRSGFLIPLSHRRRNASPRKGGISGLGCLEGIEPSTPGPQSSVLPLNYRHHNPAVSRVFIPDLCIKIEGEDEKGGEKRAFSLQDRYRFSRTPLTESLCAQMKSRPQGRSFHLCAGEDLNLHACEGATTSR